MYLCSLDEQDAAGLTQLSSTVEDVFASGDLPRAAETLANMRHCLSAVGEVMLFLTLAFTFVLPRFRNLWSDFVFRINVWSVRLFPFVLFTSPLFIVGC